MDFDFLDAGTGWAGKFKNNNDSTQMYKYVGNPFTGIFNPSKINASVGISPNPTADVASIEVSLEKITDLSLKLIDVKGNVLTENKIERTQHAFSEIDLSSYPKGIYMLLLQTEEGVISKKIFKQ